MKATGLLKKRRGRNAELYRAERLFELLARAPNLLW